MLDDDALLMYDYEELIEESDCPVVPEDKNFSENQVYGLMQEIKVSL